MEGGHHRHEDLTRPVIQVRSYQRPSASTWFQEGTLPLTSSFPTIRLMKVLDIREAVLEFSNWTTEQQLAVLTLMDSQGENLKAARILRQLPTAQRKLLLVQMDREVTARHVQVEEDGGGLPWSRLP